MSHNRKVKLRCKEDPWWALYYKKTFQAARLNKGNTPAELSFELIEYEDSQAEYLSDLAGWSLE